jgi:hypothetical protein
MITNLATNGSNLSNLNGLKDGSAINMTKVRLVRHRTSSKSETGVDEKTGRKQLREQTVLPVRQVVKLPDKNQRAGDASFV